MNHRIFREYDIRGIFDRDFDLDDVRILGRAFGTNLAERGGKSLVVGRDCRLSSPDIREALVQGLVHSGMQVVDIGVCMTPLVYFALHRLPVDGGIMITASHNPPEYNGFKLCVGRENLFGSGIRELGALITAGRFTEGDGSSISKDISNDYLSYLINSINVSRPIKVAFDSGNGTAGLLARPLFDALGPKAIHLYSEPDGRFPNHPADPTIPENMADLAAAVVENQLELGIGFDGDGDRLAVVDETGRLIPGDMLFLLFAREVLKENPGATVVGDVKCSCVLYKDIRDHGGRPVMGQSGHSLIKQRMKLENAVLAGEMSGHYCFGDRYFGIDDGIYNAARLLEILARSDRPLSEYWSDLPRVYNTPEIREHCPEEIKFQVVDRLKEDLAKDYKINDIDGIRLEFPDGWALVRPSNTGAIIVKRFEATSPERLAEIRGIVDAALTRTLKNIEAGPGH